MTFTNLKAIATEKLVARVAEIGEAQDETTLYDDVDTYNRLFDEEDAILEELKARAGDQRHALLPLLDHPNIQVRLNVAKSTLAIAPQAARREIEAIAKRVDVPQGGDAGMALWALDEGIFKPE